MQLLLFILSMILVSTLDHKLSEVQATNVVNNKSDEYLHNVERRAVSSSMQIFIIIIAS